MSNRELQNLSRTPTLPSVHFWQRLTQLGLGSSCDFSSIGIGDGNWTHFTWISCTNFKMKNSANVTELLLMKLQADLGEELQSDSRQKQTNTT